MKYGKRDGNHNDIAEVGTMSGIGVDHTDNVRHGFPDMLWSYNYRTVFLEAKNDELYPSNRPLTPPELKFARNCAGLYAVIKNVQQAANLVDILKQPNTYNYELQDLINASGMSWQWYVIETNSGWLKKAAKVGWSVTGCEADAELPELRHTNGTTIDIETICDHITASTVPPPF